MEWESLGFKDNPLNTDPIKQDTLQLYVGHKQEVVTCKNVLNGRNVNLVVEGARGVGTTSFANFLRFNSQASHVYFTPCNEIRVEAGWRLETLLAVIIANIVREIELFQPGKIINDAKFKNAKALSIRIAEAYRSFGLEAFGFGVNYGKSAGISTQPMIVSSAVLGHHLEDLISLIQKFGYRYGILVQLNNLDIGTIHDEDHMKYLFNALRDYVQTDGISWIFVGDIGLRRFIAQEVDRLDDIISFETNIDPLTKDEYEKLIRRRIEYYRINTKAEIPIDWEVFVYLYEITKGRLRYIFGLLNRLVNGLYMGDLTDRITLNIAKPMIVKLGRERVTRNGLSPNEEQVLTQLVKLKTASLTDLTKKIGKSVSYVSRLMSHLAEIKLVTSIKRGKNRVYRPVLDVEIAYMG